MNEYNKEINDILVDQLGLGSNYDIKPEQTIVDDLGADDLDSIEVLMSLEEQFGLAIPEDDWNKVVTVQDIYDYIDYRLNGGTKWKK